MARTPEIKTVRKLFLSKLDSNRNLFEAVQPFTAYGYSTTNCNPLYPGQANRVVALCYMNAVSAWEEFVEGTFIRYLAGAKSANGYQPNLSVGPCRSVQHATDVLAGQADFDITAQYLSWTKWNSVVSKAKVFFERGEPFTKVIQVYQERLEDAFKIRNRVAHTSQKCIREFCQVARHFLGLSAETPLPRGFSVGKLLLTTEVRHFKRFSAEGNYYKAYDALFRHLADLIAP